MMADMLLRLGSAFDRLVSLYDPDRGLSRHRSRQLLARAYEGASKKDGWNPKRPSASANTDHLADATSLRARSRSLTQNVPYIAQGLRSLVSNVIGTGIMPRWLGQDAATYEQLWKDWGTVCDADGRHDIYGMQAAAYRAMQQDGEVLVRLRRRRPSDGLPVPLQLQLLEIDWLDSAKSMANGSSQIINGIEYDVLGRVVGYWLFDQHPGELASPFRGRAASRFIPADSIIHLYTAERPGQGRGFPRIAPVIARVRDMQLYEDAELQRKNLETRLSVLASGNPTELANPPAPGEAVDTTAAKNGDLGPLQSGGITHMPTGLNFTLVEPKAAPGYVEYVKYNLHLIAAGFGVTYEMMTGDVNETSFSSARVSILNFRRDAEVEQWVVFIPKFCDRVCRAFADAAELAGKVGKASYIVEHSTPKWDYVNPEQDVQADLAEIAGGLGTFSEKLRKRGYKPDQVFDEWKADMEKLRGSGVLNVMLQLLKGKPLNDEEQQPAKEKEKQNKREEERSDALLRALESNTQAMQRMNPSITFTPAPIEVRAGDVNVSLAEGAVQSHTQVHPAAVSVTATANPTPVEIRNEVNPAAVHVTAQPGETHVVMAHPASSVAEHQRDPQTQEVLRTVTRYEPQKT